MACPRAAGVPAELQEGRLPLLEPVFPNAHPRQLGRGRVLSGHPVGCHGAG